MVSEEILVEWLDNVDFHKMDDNFFEMHGDELIIIHDLLSDETSKNVFDAFLNSRYSGDPKKLINLMKDDKYSYDWKLLNISPKDTILDGGAYNGDTIDEINEYVKRSDVSIYAFEPDIENYQKLLSYIKLKQYENVIAVNFGLYSHDEEIKFLSTGTMGAYINKEGDTDIKVIALDNHEEYQSATVIKMDIEGSELEALKGAKNFIRRTKPRLAICIYHHNDDIIYITNFLKAFGYSFYLRQHGYCAEETVLYAI